MKLNFRGKVRRSGNSWVVTVPSDYVENRMVPQQEELNFTVEVQHG